MKKSLLALAASMLAASSIEAAELIATPAAGTVAGLQTFTLSMSDGSMLMPSCMEGLDVTLADSYETLAVFDADALTQGVVLDEDTYMPISVVLSLPEEITAAGTYTLAIPAGTFYLGEEMAENEAVAFTYTIGGAAPELQMTYPQMNAKTAELPDNIILMFNDEVQGVDAAAIQVDYNDPIMIDAANISVAEGNTVYLNVADLKNEITAGVITVYVQLTGVELAYDFCFTLGAEFGIESSSFTAEGGQLFFTENVGYLVQDIYLAFPIFPAGSQIAVALAEFALNDDIWNAVDLTFSPSLAAGDYTLEIPAGVVVSISEEEYQGGTVDFTVEGTVSINGINVEKQNRVIFNLQGQRIGEAKGLVIMDGQKVCK